MLAVNTEQFNVQFKSDFNSVQEKKTTVYPDEQHKGESVVCSLDDDKIVYPRVVKSDGIECCVLLDSLLSSCYKLLEML